MKNALFLLLVSALVVFFFSGCWIFDKEKLDEAAVSLRFQLSGDAADTRAYQEYANWSTLYIDLQQISAPRSLFSYQFGDGASLVIQDEDIVPGDYLVTISARKTRSGSLSGVVLEGCLEYQIHYGENEVIVPLQFKEGLLEFCPTIYIDETVEEFIFDLSSPTKPSTQATFSREGGTFSLAPSVWQATITALGIGRTELVQSGPHSFEVCPDQKTTIHYSLGTNDPDDPIVEDVQVTVILELPFAPPVENLDATESENGVRISWGYSSTYDSFQILRRDWGSDLFTLIGEITFLGSSISSFSYQDDTAGGDNVYQYAINVVDEEKESGLMKKWLQTERDLIFFSKAEVIRSEFQNVHPLPGGGFVAVASNGVPYWHDSEGNEVDGKDLGARINDISEFPNGDLVMIGQKSVSGKSSDFYIARLAFDGSEVFWEKTFGGTGSDSAISVDTLPSGDLIVAGNSYSNDGDVSNNKGGVDFWILRLNREGNIIWSKSFGGSNYDDVVSVKYLIDGNFAVLGKTSSTDFDVSGSHGNYDYWMIKIDANGDMLWQKCFGFSGADYPGDFVQLPDGGFLIGGRAYSYGTSHHGGYDFWLLRLSSVGNILWEKCFGGFLDDGNYGKIRILPLPENNFLVTGSTYSNDGDIPFSHGNWDTWVFAIDQNANLLWERTFGSSEMEYPYDICQLTDGNFLWVGRQYSQNRNYGFLTKFRLNLDD